MVKRTARCPCGEKGQGIRELLQFGTGSRRELIDGARVSEDGGYVLVITDGRRAFFDVLFVFDSEGKEPTNERKSQTESTTL